MLTHTLSRSPRVDRKFRGDSRLQDGAATSSQTTQSQSKKVTSQSSASNNMTSQKPKNSLEIVGKSGQMTSNTKDRHIFGGASKMGKGASSSSDCKTVARLCAELATVGTTPDILDDPTTQSQKGMHILP